MAYELQNALFQWEDGYRRMQELRVDPRRQRRAGRVVSAIQAELRRRIGPTFAAADLADLYGSGTDWSLEVAVSVAPGDAAAWDAQTVTDAAFYLHLRDASDYEGGRFLTRAEPPSG